MQTQSLDLFPFNINLRGLLLDLNMPGREETIFFKVASRKKKSNNLEPLQISKYNRYKKNIRKCQNSL